MFLNVERRHRLERTMSGMTLTLDDLVRKTGDLPTLPAAALAVIRESDSPTASAKTIARLLSQDQALTVRILRLANSSYYGFSRQVIDVCEAVVVLGLPCIRNLCTVASTYPWMVNPFSGYGLGPREIWAHSFAVAVGAQMIALRSQTSQGEQAFTAGLLHNLGKVALGVWHEDRIPCMVYQARLKDQSLEQVEKQTLGYDHCEIGGQMGDAWNLPKALVDVMRFHHRPDDCAPCNTLVDCVHVADYLTMSMGLGLGGDGLRYEFQPRTLDRLGLTYDSLEELSSEFDRSYDRHEKLFEKGPG